MSSGEATIARVCRTLRKDPRHPDITRLLRRVWDLLVQYDESGGDEVYLGELNIMEVGAELLYVASRIDVKELERFVGHTSGLVELLFSWNAHTPAAVRAQRMEWLSEEAVHDPEYALSRAEASHQALTQFMPYVASMLASLAGLPAVQIKAVSRLVALALDGAVWTVCASALVQPLLTLAAMSNPMSSFRVEFHRMGGLAAIGLAYLEAQEEECIGVFKQVLSSIKGEELKRNVDADGMRELMRTTVAQVYDQDVADRHNVVPTLFALMFDTAAFQTHAPQWAQLTWWRKDCPSAFLKFVLQRAAELRALYPYAQRADVGRVCVSQWLGDEARRRAYQWSCFPASRRNRWREDRGAGAHAAAADGAQATLADAYSAAEWAAAAARANVALEPRCCVCARTGTKLSRCGRCKWRAYCSTACQSADWTQRNHKELCGL